MTTTRALNGNLLNVSYGKICKIYSTNYNDVLTALTDKKRIILEEIRSHLVSLRCLKWYITVRVTFCKIANNTELYSSPTFHGKTRALLSSDKLDEQFMEALSKILESMAKWLRDGSGWQLNNVEQIDLCMVKYQPLVAASHIPTPKTLAVTKGIINIKNLDNKCFLWSVLCALHGHDGSKHYRVKYYKQFEQEINMTGIYYPVKVTDLDRFEVLNPTLSVNVFGYEDEEIHMIRGTTLKYRKHINLLILTKEEKTHYCFISDISKILPRPTKYHKKVLFCNYCIQAFPTVDLLEKHIPICTPEKISTSTYIPTPKSLAHPTKGVVNIKNMDQKCFMWSVLAHLYPDKHQHNRVNYFKQFEHEIDMSGISYPVFDLTQIDKFEKLNKSISINIFAYENDEMYPVRITKEKNRETHINLLLLSNKKGMQHYCLITNMSRLLSHLTKYGHTVFYCNYCLHRFSSNELLTKHEPLCTPHGVQKTKLPDEKDKWMYFSNYTLCHKVPFTIYCDFESYIVPIDTSLNDPETSHTTNVSKHIPSGFGYVIINSEGKAIKPPEVYTGPNVIDTFLNKLTEEAKNLVPILKKNVPMVMTDEDNRDFENATDCHLCKKPLGEDKVRNHNHINGKYIGAAHNDCNLNYKVPQHIPVFFHNLKGYDCHHLIQGLGKFKKENISCMAINSERYISLTLGSLRFLDSLQFLNASLDTLVNNLASESSTRFPIFRQCIESNQNLLIRKGVFPYTWLTDVSKLLETQLPPKEAFYNDLTQTEISDEDYAHAQLVWDTFNMSTMKDYHNLYLMTDVLLLADIFENFRNTSLQYYQIDPCNVYSVPGLAWNAMLKMTDVRLELLTDIDQHLFIENGVRGGVAMIPHRYAKANNPLLSDFDPTRLTSYLMYLDCNNLYGDALSNPQPESDFMWLQQEEIDRLKITEIPDDAEKGYIFEVDLHYPKHLHELHSDYPLAPVRKVVTEDMLSPYSKLLLDELNYKPAKVHKLLTTLEDKEKYILHYRNLKLYLELGLQLKKIHRVLTFKQSAWLAPFISFNTEKRKCAKNDFDKDFFKLINNATYGKSLENVRSRIDFKLVNNEKKLLKWTASPRLTNFFAYNEDLVGLTLKKQTILLNKPIYIGFTVLEISKVIMYNFHYNWTVKKYGANVKLCMTDTDSLFYHIKTPDVYEDLRNDLNLFDTSEYPVNHPCFSEYNKKKLGKFKDELKGQPPVEVIGLRAKCYSVLKSMENDSEEEPNKKEEEEKVSKRVAKGVARVAIRKQLRHTMYKQCLFHNTLKTTSALNIRSDRHQLYTQHISKLSLTPYDDKRYILDDGINTLAYGHYKIKRILEEYEEPPPTKKRKIDETSALIES